MATSKTAKQPAGTTHIKLQVQITLHDVMKRLREIRHQIEGSDVKLCRMYQEAVEQYINGKAQQKLLTEWGVNGTPKTRRAAGD
jgi:hypothetical protein